MESALILVCMFLWSGASVAEPWGAAPLSAGQDMHIRSPEMTVYTAQPGTWDHIASFAGGVTVTVGDNRISGKEGFLWLKLQGSSLLSSGERYYQAYLYLEGNVSIEQGPASKTTAVRQAAVQGADAAAAHFVVTGNVLSSVERRSDTPFSLVRTEPMYQRGLEALSPLAFGPGFPKAHRLRCVRMREMLLQLLPVGRRFEADFGENCGRRAGSCGGRTCAGRFSGAYRFGGRAYVGDSCYDASGRAGGGYCVGPFLPVATAGGRAYDRVSGR